MRSSDIVKNARGYFRKRKWPVTKKIETASRQVMSYQALAACHVTWYLQHGKYPNRIVKDSAGVKYVIGDWSWERRHPSKYESIEKRLSAHSDLIEARLSSS
jgi:formate-dependent nitrite reductase cytochrome c552 subunit